MRRAVLLYNPQSGQKHARRRVEVERAASFLKAEGIDVVVEPTTGPRSAEQQVRRFVADGLDTIVACGGDGTVNDVLQGIAGSHAALGVLPLGTANSLACDLGLPRDPAKAARHLLEASVRLVAIGSIEYQRDPLKRESRFFTVAAGVGLDAALFYRLNAAFKKRWGMAAYLGESLRQWAIQKYHPFRVEWFDMEQNTKRTEVATQLLAVRILNFGGIVKHLAPGADLLRDDLRLLLFKTASRARFLRFVAGRMIGRNWQDRHIELVHASQVSCLPYRDDDQHRHGFVHAEADGEWLGRLPVAISTIPNALNLLVPKTANCLLKKEPLIPELPSRLPRN